MTDISEYFSRDPRQLSDQDIDKIIAKMRESRHQFNLGNMKAGSMKKASPKIAQLSDELKGLDLKL